jgi:hypothetical protein
VRGINDKLAVYSAQSTGSDRALEGDLAYRKGGACANHRQNVGVVFTVRTQDVRYDLHFLEVAFGKEGPDGPVDLPGCQSFLGARSSLSLYKSARKLAGSTLFFTIFDTEREKIDIVESRRRRHGRDKNNGVPILDYYRTVCLSGDLACLYGQSLPANLSFYSTKIYHILPR